MDQLILSAQRRSATGTGAARQYRREGKIPAVVYGQGLQTTPILIDGRQFETLLRQGASQIVDLKVEGVEQDADLAALIKKLDRQPVSREILSIDFQWISMKEEITVSIPVVLTGISPVVENEGAVLDQILFEIEIACIPSKLPQSLEVDISSLDVIGASLHVAALTAPDGVRFLAAEDEAVVTIGRPVSAEDLETRVEGEEDAEVVEEAVADDTEVAAAEESAPEEEAAE